jgi:hypothetical protein
MKSYIGTLQNAHDKGKRELKLYVIFGQFKLNPPVDNSELNKMEEKCKEHNLHKQQVALLF